MAQIDLLTSYPDSMIDSVPGAPGYGRLIGVPGFPFKATPNMDHQWPILIMIANGLGTGDPLEMNVAIMSWDHAIECGFGTPADGGAGNEPAIGYSLQQHMISGYAPRSVNKGGYTVEGHPSPSPDIVRIRDIYGWEYPDGTCPGGRGLGNLVARKALSSAEFVEGKLGRSATGQWFGYLLAGQRVHMGLTRAQFFDMYRASALNGMRSEARSHVAAKWPVASASGLAADWLAKPADLWFHFKWNPTTDVIEVGRWFGKVESSTALPIVVPPGTGDKQGVPHAESYICESDWARTGTRPSDINQMVWFEPVLEGAMPIGSNRTFIGDRGRIIGDLSVVASEIFLDAEFTAQPSAEVIYPFENLALGALSDFNHAAAANASANETAQEAGVQSAARKSSDCVDILTISVDFQQAAVAAAANG